jgi:hypothetical protein
MRLVQVIVFLLACVSAFAQSTRIDLSRLVKPSAIASKVFVTDASGATAWSDAAGILTAGAGVLISGNTISATLTGSGATGRVTYYSASNTLTSSPLLLTDGNRLAVGSSSYDVGLTVFDAAGSHRNGMVLRNSTTSGYSPSIFFQPYGYAESAWYDAFEIRTRYSPAGSQFSIVRKNQPSSSPIDVMHINSIGIGLYTTNPTVALDVVGQVKTSGSVNINSNILLGSDGAVNCYNLSIAGNTGSSYDLGIFGDKGIRVIANNYANIPNPGSYYVGGAVLDARGFTFNTDGVTNTVVPTLGIAVAVSRSNPALVVKNAIGVAILVESGGLDVSGVSRIRGALNDGTNASGASGQVLTSTGSATQWVSASTLATLNIYNSDGALTANRTITTSTNALTIDASGATGVTFSPLIVKGKESSPATRYFEGQDNAGTWRMRIQASSATNTFRQNGRDLTIDANSILRLETTSGGENAWTLYNNKATGWTSVATDPSPVNYTVWANSTDKRFKYKAESVAKSLANTEDDIIGNDLLVSSSTHTPSGVDYSIRYDANSNAITVTLGNGLLDGYTYVVRCTRNATNTVTFNAEGGLNLAISGDSALTPTSMVSGGAGTGIRAPYLIYHIKRKGGTIYIN